LPLVHPRQINLVGLKRLDGGTYGDCKRPVPPVKSRAGPRRLGQRQMLVAAKNRGNLAREDGGEWLTVEVDKKGAD